MSEATNLDQTYKVIGTRPVRPDGVDKVTGRAGFGADMVLPGMLHGLVLRSPHAHARILSIDTSAAKAIAGVKAVLVGADLPSVAAEEITGGEGSGDMADLASNVLARDKVVYHGHAVAAVAATSLTAAAAAIKAIKVEYETLTPVMTVDAALAEGAPLVNEHCFTQGLPEQPKTPSNIAKVMDLVRGDVDAALAAADIVLEGTFTTPTVHQGYIEPHACVVRANEGDQATIWTSTQSAFDVRSLTAKVLGWDLGRIKVVPTEIGGGFGGKTTVYLEPVAVALSRRSGRPVRMTMSREEVFRASGPGSGTKMTMKIGAMNDGTITAMDAWLAFEAGAYAGSPMVPGVMCAAAPYKIANFRIKGLDVLVNKPKVAAYRAPGAPQAMFPTESLIDELARKLDMDPIELRLRNAVGEGDQAPYGPKFGPIGLEACLQAAKAHPNYQQALAENEGRGVAVGFWFNAGMQSSAEVHLNEDGTATVVEGNPDIGGSRASMALMCAEELGIPYAKVQVTIADTESAPFTDVTGGSRVTFATGMAVIQASRDVVKQLRERAAATWGVDVDMVDWQDGRAVPREGVNVDAEPLTIAEIAGKSGRTGGPLLGRASLNARGAGPSFSVNFTDVHVDPDTGRSTVKRFTAIQDAGKAIHPSYVEGQFQGGAAQGIGWALNEEYVWSDLGIMENAGFLDYRIPVASDLPMIDTQIVEVANPAHPYGVRGVGETPIVAPLSAVANAVSRATGKRFHDLPLSPPRVLAAIDGNS